MDLFGTIKYSTSINEISNFNNFSHAFVLLIKILTGDGWSQVMNDIAFKSEGCYDLQTYTELINIGPQGCGSWYSYPFFLSFILINRMVIMNLFIAVVVETFMTKTCKSDKIDEKQLEIFYQLWGYYDKEVRYCLAPTDFVLLMLELEFPLGLNGDPEFVNEYDKKRKMTGNIHISCGAKVIVDDKQCIRILNKLNIICRNENVQLIDAIIFLTKRSMQGEISDDSLNKLMKFKRLSKNLDNTFKKYQNNYNMIVQNCTATESSKIVAKKIMSKFLRNWRKNRELK